MMGERRISISEDLLRPQMLTLREFRPFKTSDEYLWAMKEDLSDWLNLLYPELRVTPITFMESLETGITLCKHANNVRSACKEWLSLSKKLPKCWGREWKLPTGEVTLNANARPETFYARDNVHNFITWCRKLGIFECLLFESDDLILRKNEKSVILCLLEVARRGSYFGMASPLLVQFEKEIDRDIAKDTGGDISSSSEEEESFQEYGPIPQIITNDLRSLDEMVRELVERCSCPTQFPMIRVAEGKYRIGNTKVMIYVRILRNHVMVRVGGGWDTLEHYLDKHDPCRCSIGHRAAISSKLTMRHDNGTPVPRMKVEYERRDLTFDPTSHSTSLTYHQQPPNGHSRKASGVTDLSDSSSEISDEGYKTSDNLKLQMSGTPAGPPSTVMSSMPLNFKGSPHARKFSFTRARSLSTDEERPESRSTDEETMLGPPPSSSSSQRDRPILKSASTGRVPRMSGGTNPRSVSTERPNQTKYGDTNGRQMTTTGLPRTSLHHYPNKSQHISPIHQLKRPNVNHNKITGRSLSASGTAEFFGRSGTAYPTKTSALTLDRNRTKNSAAISASCRGGLNMSGKNTWNGPGTTGSNLLDKTSSASNRIRPNLFHYNFFNEDQPRRSSSNESEISSEEGLPPSSTTSSEDHINLALWIKRALELDSDADKISHIEEAIKQFEQQTNSPPLITDYGHEDPQNLSNNAFNSIPNIPNFIRKRKETGVTKIPKPCFY